MRSDAPTINSFTNPARKVTHWSMSAFLVLSIFGLLLPGSHADASRYTDGKSSKPNLIVQTGHKGRIWTVDVSANGKIIVSGGQDKTVRLWEFETGHLIRILEGTVGEVTSVVISPNGKFVASAGWEEPLRIWDAETGIQLRSIAVHTQQISKLKFIDDGNVIAGNDRDTVRLWDVAAGVEIRSFIVANDDAVSAIAASPDFRLLAAATMSGRIAVWDMRSGEQVRLLSGHRDMVRALEFAPDGKSLASAGHDIKGVSVWNLETGSVHLSLDLATASFVTALTFTSEGSMIAVASGNSVELWQIPSGRRIKTLNRHTDRIWSIAFSPDDQVLVSGSDDSTIRFWRVSSGLQFNSLEAVGNSIRTLGVSDDRVRLAFADDQHRIQIFDLISGSNIRTLGGHTAAVETIVFSPSGSTIASAGQDNTIRLWEAESGRQKAIFESGGGLDRPLAFSNDAKLLAAAGDGNTFAIWDLDTLRKLRTVDRHESWVKSIMFLTDGESLATLGFDGDLMIWSVSTGDLITSIEGGVAVNYAAWSAETQLFVTARDATVRLREQDKGSEIRRIESISLITSVALSNSGDILAVGSYPNSVRLFATRTGQELRSLDGHTNWITTLEFLAGDSTLISGSWDGHIRIWNVENGDELLAITFLSEGEWVVTTPEGRFDTNKDLSSIEGLHWVIPDDPMTPVPLEIFMRDYYEPGLLQRLLRCNTDDTCGTEFKPLPNIAELNRVQPKINDEGIRVIPKQGGGRVVDVEVTIESATGEYKTETGTTTLTSGVYDLRLFRNGQMVGQSTPYERREAFTRAAPELIEKNRKYYEQTKRRTNTPELEAWRTANDLSTVKDVKADGKGKYTYTFRDIKLPTEGSSEVEFAAYAFNSDRVKSGQAVKTYVVSKDVTSQRARGRAYVVTFGVNKYESPVWNLRYAANDARKMSELLTANLSKGGSFAEVVPIPLIADDENAGDGLIERRDATKANIRSVFELLAGNQPDKERLERLTSAIGAATLAKIREAMPEDAVIMSFSSHGYADQNGIFYILPTDIGSETRRTVTPELLRSSISSDELSLWLGDVDAGEMVIVVDACNADAAVRNSEFKPAPMGSRGLGQLAYDKGMQILTATQADNVAIESGGKIGHGLLNYALLKEGIEASAADFQPKDGKVLLREWLEYGETRVPKLYEELAAGTLKATGRDVIQIDIGGKDSGTVTLQRPTLFDFRKRPRGLILARIE